MRRRLQIMMMVLGAVGFCAAVGLAQETPHSKHTEREALNEAVAKRAQPGEPHRQLARRLGKWTTKTKSWIELNQPPAQSTGACEHTMVLGGRFLRQDCTGEMGGQPFVGLGIMGYDNHTHHYVSIWVDSMGTGLFHMEGPADSDGSRITQRGRYEDPVDGTIRLRAVTTMVDAENEVFEMYATGKSGREMKMTEILYRRIE